MSGPELAEVVRFGVSTHLFHEERLQLGHLEQVASHGFDAIELFATRSHFDYHDEAAIRTLGEWLASTGLRLHSLHGPIMESFSAKGWGPAFSNASSDQTLRARSIRETELAVRVADVLPYRYLVLHLGLPDEQRPSSGDNVRERAVRSLEEIAGFCNDHHVQVAVEVIPNSLSNAESLVRMIEDDIDLPDVGICLDFGHAHIMSDVVDAIENVSGHLWTTHIHDNNGRRDDHLVPFEGSIEWARALMATQKVGYDGTYMLEVAGAGAPADVLARSAVARRKFERYLMLEDA